MSHLLMYLVTSLAFISAFCFYIKSLKSELKIIATKHMTLAHIKISDSSLVPVPKLMATVFNAFAY